MKRLVTVLVVALAFGTAVSAASAQAMPADQQPVVWQHVCAASGGTASFPEASVFSCARTPAGWNPGSIRQFQYVCLDAFGARFYSYFGTPAVEVARCILV